MERNFRNKNRPNNIRRNSSNSGKASWNTMATWYDSMVGSEGHKFHQNYAIPAVMRMLDIKSGDTILDVGCGQGALSPYVNKAGGIYYGVDSSENMIRSAIERHKDEGKFFVGSADDLQQNGSLINSIKNSTKDSTNKNVNTRVNNNAYNSTKDDVDNIVFLLSLQDMNPLDKILASACKLLKPNGKIVILMLHPAFRIPRQSGWGEDKQRKLNYRRMDRYLTETTIPLDTKIRVNGNSVTSYFYHRPLEKYFHELNRNGILIDNMLEIAEDKKGYSEFPTFLCLRGIKKLS